MSSNVPQMMLLDISPLQDVNENEYLQKSSEETFRLKY